MLSLCQYIFSERSHNYEGKLIMLVYPLIRSNSLSTWQMKITLRTSESKLSLPHEQTLEYLSALLFQKNRPNLIVFSSYAIVPHFQNFLVSLIKYDQEFKFILS